MHFERIRSMKYKKKYIVSPKPKIAILLVAICIAIFSICHVHAQESSSTNFTVQGGTFGGSDSMDSTNYSVNGTFGQISTGSWSASNIPLSAGTITSCGTITTSGTYTLNSDLSEISGPCFIIIADGVTINGAGYTITASTSNNSYAIVATSSTSNGGSAYNNITVENITLSGFAGGIDANGNDGTSSGGNGGSVIVSSSTMVSITANGGNTSSGTGGNGGSITLSGTNMDLVGKSITTTKGSGTSSGTDGTVQVNGSVLVQNGETWAGDDHSWSGSRTWTFQSGAYNTGTTTGTTTFLAYTASSGTVTIDGVTNLVGTGRVYGSVLDSVGSSITTWYLKNGSILIGMITGNVIFNDTSKNSGIVTATSTFNDIAYNAGTTTNAMFTATSFSALSGIPSADPTGISSGHTVTGTVLFSATTSPVTFNVNGTNNWYADTSSWVFATSGQNWIFSSRNNAGYLKGDVVFSKGSNLTTGTIDGTATFLIAGINSGTIATSSFYGTTYNRGVILVASFHDTSVNSFGSFRGNVLTRCDFYDFSSPGKGTCPSGATYYHTPYYFNAATSTNWNDLGNWWLNSSHTLPATSLPSTGDTVVIGAKLTTGPSVPVSSVKIIIASSTLYYDSLGSATYILPSGGAFSVNLTNASGPAYFYASSTNSGQIDGIFNIYGNRSFSSVNATGTYTGTVELHDGSWNDTTLLHNAVFHDTSYNDTGAIVDGNAEFAGNNTNNGSVLGSATIDAGATLVNGGTIQGNILNYGTISSGTFNTLVTNVGGVISGAINNLLSMIFNGGGYISSSGSLSGDAVFNATSSNRGLVSGTSTFNDSAYNIGSTSNATFVGDYSENFYGATSGIVSGVKTRLYNALNQQVNLLRNFATSAWTIVADNTVVKLIYRDLVDLFGRNPSTTTTLVERNGGLILRPLSTSTPVTSCGILDSANSTYTLGADIANYQYDTCFYIRADGITLDGNGHTVTALSSTSSLYAVVATSTLSIDPSPNAFTGLTIENISFLNFAHGLWGVGNDVPNGTAGNGASTTIKFVTIGDINVSGGDPTEQAGNGGNIYIETSTTTVITSNGGDSTNCGYAGNGGSISITTDVVYATTSNKGGTVSGCSTAPQSTQYGSSGSFSNSYVSAQTSASQAAAAAAAAAASAAAAAGTNGGATWGSGNIYSVTPSVLRLHPLSDLKTLPTFGASGGKGSFSLGKGIDSFFNSPLPDEVIKLLGPSLIAYLKTAGFESQNDLFKIRDNPLLLPFTDEAVAGLFKIHIKGIPIKVPGESFGTASSLPVDAYLTTRDLHNFIEKITLSPQTDFTVELTPMHAGRIHALWNGKDIVFDGNKVTLTSPTNPGTYLLISSSSPLTLQVDVVGNKSLYQSFVDATSWFVQIIHSVISFLGNILAKIL